MEHSSVLEKLKNVDKELHLLIDELDSKEDKEVLSLEELQKVMRESRVSDEDSTDLIRKMRDKEY
jgi:hypothetical protein